jgi:hypothetical protein
VGFLALVLRQAGDIVVDVNGGDDFQIDETDGGSATPNGINFGEKISLI